MTPEERFTKIENAIQALTEVQARHEAEIEKQNAGIRDLIVVNRTLLDTVGGLTGTVGGLTDAVGGLAGTVGGLEKIIEELGEAQKNTDAKLNALIEHEQVLDRNLSELSQAQLATEKKLNALIDTVDRITRKRRPS